MQAELAAAALSAAGLDRFGALVGSAGFLHNTLEVPAEAAAESLPPPLPVQRWSGWRCTLWQRTTPWS